MTNGLITDSVGNKYYFKDGRYHRDDGPAIEFVGYPTSHKYYFLFGEQIASKEEYFKLIKLKAFW